MGTQTIAQEKVSWRSFNWEHFRGKKSRWKHLNKASLTLPKSRSGSSSQTFDIFTGRTNLMWAFYTGKMYFYFKMKWWRSRGWIFNWQGAWQLIGTETVSKCYVSMIWDHFWTTKLICIALPTVSESYALCTQSLSWDFFSESNNFSLINKNKPMPEGYK